MVEFLNATQARGEIERILSRAKKLVVMIAPHIKISDDLVSRLMDAGQRSVKIVLVCHEEDLSSEERKRLEQTPNLVLRCNEHVHAQCFYNDEAMVLTSLNLNPVSYEDSHEMGVLLRTTLDADKYAFQDAVGEANIVIRESSDFAYSKPGIPAVNTELNGRTGFMNKPAVEIQSAGTVAGEGQGYCIRCGNIIPFNLDEPYCAECFKRWVVYREVARKEKNCHMCGLPIATTKKNPLCLPCSRKSRQNGF